MGGELHPARRGVGHERAMRRWCACKQRRVLDDDAGAAVDFATSTSTLRFAQRNLPCLLECTSKKFACLLPNKLGRGEKCTAVTQSVEFVHEFQIPASSNPVPSFIAQKPVQPDNFANRKFT